MPFRPKTGDVPQDEVKGLMLIIEDVIERELIELHKQGVQLRHIGRLEGLRPQLIQKVKDAIQLTRENDRLVLCIAFNYGGRDEITCAIRRMLSDKVDQADVSEESGQQIPVHVRYTRPRPDHPYLR